MLDAYSAWLKRLSTVTLWLAGGGLVAMTVLVAWQVFGRYALNATPTWTEPSVLLLMSWFILLGAAVGVREGDHMGFEVGLNLAPRPLRFVMRITTAFVVLAFGISMAWYGAELARKTWSAAMPLIGISQGWDYVPMAMAGVLVALFAIERIALLAMGRDGSDRSAAGHGAA
jgi:TRAP-type C4-dicarboxylate transport system permease small subunit